MKKSTLTIIFTTFALLLGITLTAFPQGKGQRTTGQTATKGDRDKDRTRDQDRDRDRDRSGDLDQDRDRDRIRANDQQRDQLRTDLGTMDKIRLQVRSMVRVSDNDAFNVVQARQHHEQLRAQIRNMEQEHERFMLGLNEYQKNRFQQNLRGIQQHRERVNNHLQLMEQEMNQQQFNRIQHRTRLREIEKAVKGWEEQLHNMEKHMVNR